MLVRTIADRAAEGRAFGNLGNTHYLLGNFDKAVQYHEEVGTHHHHLLPLDSHISILNLDSSAK